MLKWPYSCRLAGLFAMGCFAQHAVMAAPQTIAVSDEAGQPVANAAVAVYVKGAVGSTTGKTVDMAQRDRTFVPKLVVIQTGTAVNFPNFDTVRHHVYSFSSIKPFEIKLYAGRPAAPVVFDKAGNATLGCNIHDGMIGYIHVVDTPYLGTTGANGKVDIDLPAGEHRIQVWTPAMGEATLGQDLRLATSPDPITFRIKK